MARKLIEYFKSPIPSLLGLFNLRRVTPGPMLPVQRDQTSPGQLLAPGEQKDPFLRPTQTIVDQIKHRGDSLNRVQRYAIYEEMVRDPLNNEILNAYAEAVTTFNADKGAVFWVTAQNEDVVNILTEMYGRVGAQEKAFAQVKAMFMRGDNFLGLKYTDKSHGVLALRYYEPWRVARVEDELDRLIGFSTSDETGEPKEIDTAGIPPYDILHQRLLSHDQEHDYGASLFENSWEKWEDLQSMEDQMVLQRLLRRPDRIMILMDTTGMGYAEAWEQIRIWEKYLYKEINVNTASRLLESRGIPMTENRDLIIPKGPGSNTEITTVPATNTNDLYRDVEMLMSRYIGSVGMPKGYFGFEGGEYRADISLAKQDPRFSKRAQRGQFAYLHAMTRLGMINLGLCGLDPLRAENRFEVHGMPISNFMEIEYNELLQMRFDLVDRMARAGQDLNLPTETWYRYVLTNVAKLPRDLVDALLAKPEEGGTPGEAVTPKQAAYLQDAAADQQPLFEAVDEMDRAYSACTQVSGAQSDLKGSLMESLEKDKGRVWDEGIIHGSPAGASLREFQMTRAKNRLDRLHAMACSIG